VNYFAKPARNRKSNGQSLVEFALTLPLIVLIIVGLIDLGRGVYMYNTLAQAARQANRTAIVDQDVNSVVAVAASSAATLGLSSANVDVCFKTSGSTQTNCNDPTADPCSSPYSIGCLAIVRTHIAFSPLTPIISSLVGSIQMSSTSIEPIEYVCPTSTHPTCP
jgi:Flp pilus assembly protein TadG